MFCSFPLVQVWSLLCWNHHHRSNLCPPPVPQLMGLRLWGRDIVSKATFMNLLRLWTFMNLDAFHRSVLMEAIGFNALEQIHKASGAATVKFFFYCVLVDRYCPLKLNLGVAVERRSVFKAGVPWGFSQRTTHNFLQEQCHLCRLHLLEPQRPNRPACLRTCTHTRTRSRSFSVYLFSDGTNLTFESFPAPPQFSAA